MEKKIKQLITDMFPDLLRENLGSFQNMIVPQHKHNKVDSPAIDSFTINTNNNQGFVFGTSGNQINLKYNPKSNIAGFITSPISNITFEIGQFKEILLRAYDGTNASNIVCLPGDAYLESTDGTHTADFDMLPQSAVFSITGGGKFSLTLPDATRPTAAKGMLAFDTANFYASRAATWEYIPTSTAVTGVGTVAAGTVDIIINGTTYHVLHT